MTPRSSTDPSIAYSQEDIRPAASTSRFIDAAGLRLHYLDYGTPGRPPMLCVHGGAAHAHWFDFVASSFNAHYHVRALDHRGHGDSAWAQPPDYAYEHYASELATVVEKLDLQDFVLVGHSMGGKISLVYAATYPGRVAKLVVIDSNMLTTPERSSETHAVGARPGRTYAKREEFMKYFHLRPPDTLAAPAIIAHIAQNSCKQLADGRWRHKFDRKVYTEQKTVNSISLWDRVRIPALLIKGELSERITPQVCAEVKARCPQVEIAEVARSYHHVTLDNPTGFTRAVQTFLAKDA